MTGVSAADGGSWRYFYTRLGEKKFQELCCALLVLEFPGVTCFPVGQKDGGRDAVRWVDGRSVIYQVKWTNDPVRDPVAWLRRAIGNEADNIRRLVSDGAIEYYMMTNVAGTAARGRGSMDRLTVILNEYSMSFGIPVSCWWQADIDARVDRAPWELKMAYRAMLAGDDLAWGYLCSGAGGRADSGPGPVTLPADPEIFTGRTALLSELLECLDPVQGKSGVTVVSAVDGMGGVGKTALAVHAARLAHDRGWFPGGVLLENLRGFSTDSPVDYGSAAARLLRALGVPGAEVPDTAQGRRAAWQDRLARLGSQQRPLLVVLDNVASAGQVSPLLPGPPHRILITSRNTLSALDARRVRLPPFTPDESMRFLDSALRSARPADSRADSESGQARRLAELCGHLPLALRIIVALLRDEPDRPLASLTAELADAATRLERLSYDDADEQGQTLAIRAAFDLSYQHLIARPGHARALRLLACIPGPDVSTDAAAAALGAPAADARRLLADLARRHWLDTLTGERWGMHGLVRLYAKQRARDHADEDGLDIAMERLFGFFADVLYSADAWLRSSRMYRPARPGRFGCREDAVTWLDAEYKTIAATVTGACTSQRWDQAFQLASRLWSYQEFRFLADDAITIAELGLAASCHLGRSAQCSATVQLGNAHRIARHYQEAASHLTRALELAPADDPACEGSIRHNLGLAYLMLGRFADAESCHRRDLEICQQKEDWPGTGPAMLALADALRELGRVREAIGILNTAVELCEKSGDPRNLVLARLNLARTCLKSFPSRAAFVIWQLCAALKHARDLDDRRSQALGFLNLAVAYLNRCTGCHASSAAEWARRAANLYREQGDECEEARAVRVAQSAEAAEEEAALHRGCPGDGSQESQRLRAWLDDLPYAVLRGADSRLDEVAFFGTSIAGPTPDGSPLADELLAFNPLRQFLPGDDLTAGEATALLQDEGQLNGSDAGIEAIAAEMGYRAGPLALAAAFLRREQLSAITFFDLLDTISLDDPDRPDGPGKAGADKMAALAIESAQREAPQAARVLDVVALLAPGPVRKRWLAAGFPSCQAAEIDTAVRALADTAIITIDGDQITANPAAGRAASDRSGRRGAILSTAASAVLILDRVISATEGTAASADHVTTLSQQITTVWSAARPELAGKSGQGAAAWAGAASMMKLRAWQVNFLASIAARPAEAIGLGDAVLDDCERFLGQAHQETWRARNNLAGAHAAAGNYDRACALLAQNLQLHYNSADHQDTLRTRHNLGVMHEQAGRPKRAARILTEVLADRERVQGSRHPDTLETRHWLGVAHARAGNLPEATLHLEESAEGRREYSLPPAHLAVTLDALAELYAMSGRTGDAVRVREESTAIKEDTLTPGDIDLIQARDELAELYLSNQEFKKATALLKRNLAEARQSQGRDAEITRLARIRLRYAQQRANEPRQQAQ